MIEIREHGDESVHRFATSEEAGAWLREQGWPEGLLYAPDADRLGLAERMRYSPWIVSHEP